MKIQQQHQKKKKQSQRAKRLTFSCLLGHLHMLAEPLMTSQYVVTLIVGTGIRKLKYLHI